MGGVRAFLICNNLKQQGEVIRISPDIFSDETLEVKDCFTVIYASKAIPDEILHMVDVDEVQDIRIRDVTEVDQYDIVQSQGGAEQEGTPEKGKEASVAAKEETAFDRREDRSISRTVRVDIEKLDLLLNLAGELVINRGRAIEQANQLTLKSNESLDIEELDESLQEQGRLINQMQEAIMSTRMVPIGQVFSPVSQGHPGSFQGEK